MKFTRGPNGTQRWLWQRKLTSVTFSMTPGSSGSCLRQKHVLSSNQWIWGLLSQAQQASRKVPERCINMSRKEEREPSKERDTKHFQVSEPLQQNKYTIYILSALQMPMKHHLMPKTVPKVSTTQKLTFWFSQGERHSAICYACPWRIN